MQARSSLVTLRHSKLKCYRRKWPLDRKHVRSRIRNKFFLHFTLKNYLTVLPKKHKRNLWACHICVLHTKCLCKSTAFPLQSEFYLDWFANLVFALAIPVSPVRLHSFRTREARPAAGLLLYWRRAKKYLKWVYPNKYTNCPNWAHLRHTGQVPAPIGVAVAVGTRSAGGVA